MPMIFASKRQVGTRESPSVFCFDTCPSPLFSSGPRYHGL